MNDTSSRNGKYFDIDEILIEEEVNNIVFVLDSTQNCPILMWNDDFFSPLQLVPVVFHKSANGVKVDPSAEKDCVSSKRICAAVCCSCVYGCFVTVLFSYIYFLVEFLGWCRCKSRAALLAFSGVIFEASCINKCSCLLQSKVIIIVLFLFPWVFFSFEDVNICLFV